MTLPVDVSLLAPPELPEADLAAGERIRRMAESLPESGLLTRGYDKAATDALIARACMVLDDLTNQLQDQRVKLETMWAELTARRTGYLADSSMSSPGASMLVNIQQSAMKQSDDVIQIASEQGALIVETAQAQAAEVLAAARAQAGSVDARTRRRLAEVQQVADSLLACVSRNAEALTEAHDLFRGELHRLAGEPPAAHPGFD